MYLELISRAPYGAPRDAPLLFVHGAWHGAWCWEEHFLPYFASQGYSAHALSLSGHGKSDGRSLLRWARLSDYVEDVAAIARTFEVPPVVIGHSMGSAVVQKYLARYPASAGVLLAPVPPGGVLGTTVRVARRHPLRFLLANLSLSLYPLVENNALARELFFSASMHADKVERYAKQLQDESYLAFLDMLVFDRPHRPRHSGVPTLVLGAGDDAVFTPRDVAACARALGTEAVMFAGMAHDMMLEAGWREVADHILAWLTALPSIQLPETAAQK